VSDLLASPPDDDEDSSRGRAVWGLVALAIIAGLIIVVMLATSGGSGHHSSNPTGLSGLSTEPLSSTSPPSTPSSTPTPTPSSSTPSTSAVPTSTANPCGAAKACMVPGDAGQLVAAVNQFRAGHGQAAVAGTVTPQAQQCAAAQGEGPACAPSYAWEPVPTQDGPKAVGLVSPTWLLDPAMKSFQVGWAYANGQWECAILKIR
jgi:hypothetical protein